MENMEDQSLESTVFIQEENHNHMAVFKLQKAYKSFRTRRKLPEYAILLEQIWWKLLDFVELKQLDTFL
ncbi:unnamed protein product [Trifolium pratense]|uniref:Uncharacterized protein n=1 Tax=Trifolium pratense TaxID=57577 RepID=A0ACB0KG54_TRIPR|nr:unnamed protein product [Trifolium pratense]